MVLSRCIGRQHHSMLRGITFLSHAWGIRPITTHWIAGQSQHSSLFRAMSLVKIYAFQKAGHRGETIMYSMWKIMCFLSLKPHKHISLHQIHKIMFFLATSYDPFNSYYPFIYHIIHSSYYYFWIYIHSLLFLAKLTILIYC